MRRTLASVLWLVLIGGSASIAAFESVQTDDVDSPLPGMTRAFVEPALQVTPQLEGASMLEARGIRSLSAFRGHFKGNWDVRWDRRSDRPNLVQGSGIALLPGRASGVDARTFGLSSNETIELDRVADAVGGFMKEVGPLLRLDGVDLQLDRKRSVSIGAGRDRWFVNYAQYHQGVPVRGAYAFFRIVHGNVVQFGTQRVAEVELDATPAQSRETAWRNALGQLQLAPGAGIAEIIDAGELLVLPIAASTGAAGVGYHGQPGHGYAHRLAWRFVYRLAGITATYEMLFDAHAGRIIEVRDLNAYADATVEGGVIEALNTEPEVVLPLPYLRVTEGPPPFIESLTDLLGRYDYHGGTVEASLSGRYVTMWDQCGSSLLGNGTDGHLNFGISPGTDCATPAVGGAGNTRAARTSYYHLNRIAETARGYLPDNPWLQSTLTAVVNIDASCNAYWDGGSVNFFKSSGRCANTGEILGVALHEWGHGLDSNDGGPFVAEYGSGEAMGDTFAVLATRNACVGPGFYRDPAAVCHHCTTCTGVRDVSVFARRAPLPIASPANVTAATGMNCGRLIGKTGVACPYIHPTMGVPYQGVMGYEGHCESLIASSAVWDLTQSLIARYGEDAGYTQMESIWYASLSAKGSAYQISEGAQCDTSATVDGCGAENWYTVFLAADDDDGDLSNGTPNACRIWSAMEAHGIACGERPQCTADPDALFSDGFDVAARR